MGAAPPPYKACHTKKTESSVLVVSSLGVMEFFSTKAPKQCTSLDLCTVAPSSRAFVFQTYPLHCPRTLRHPFSVWLCFLPSFRHLLPTSGVPTASNCSSIAIFPNKFLFSEVLFANRLHPNRHPTWHLLHVISFLPFYFYQPSHRIPCSSPFPQPTFASCSLSLFSCLWRCSFRVKPRSKVKVLYMGRATLAAMASGSFSTFASNVPARP